MNIADETLTNYSFLSRYHYTKSKKYLQRRYRIRHWIPMFIGTPCIYFAFLGVCLSVSTSLRMYINKRSLGKVYRLSKFKKIFSNKILFALNFENLRIFLFVIVSQCIQRENVQDWNKRWTQRVLKINEFHKIRLKQFPGFFFTGRFWEKYEILFLGDFKNKMLTNHKPSTTILAWLFWPCRRLLATTTKMTKCICLNH